MPATPKVSTARPFPKYLIFIGIIVTHPLETSVPNRLISSMSQQSASIVSPANGNSDSQLLDSDALRRKLERLELENQHLRNRTAALEEQINGIVTSRSWRLTSGLRSIFAVKRTLFPLWRRGAISLDLSPGRNTQRKGECFQVVGPSSYLEVATSKPLETGFHIISGRLQADTDHHYFYLYPRVDGHLLPDLRKLIPLSTHGENRTLVSLPPNIEGVRLDPFESEGQFGITDLKLKPLGSLQLAGWFLQKHLVPVLSQPSAIVVKFRKLFALLRSGGLTAVRIKLLADQYTNNYQEWVKRYDTLSDSDRSAILKDIGKLETKPKISVLMPTYNTPAPWLRAAVESVQRQLYENWELCIADDCSTEPGVVAFIRELARNDERIKLVVREENGHISAASNSALEIATGEYCTLLDHDDELSEHALYHVVAEINRHPDAVLLYSDEDKITEQGLRFNPYFKTDWNPELLRRQNYICHLSTYTTNVLREVGGFRVGFEGAQDWDLALRVSDHCGPRRIRHIPHVLYHWRVISSSTAHSTDAKPYVLEAQKRAVVDHLARAGVGKAKVSVRRDISHLKIEYPVPEPAPLVSIIIPTRDGLHLLKRCVESILKRTSYQSYEIIIVDNGSVEEATISYFKNVTSRNKNVRVLRDDRPFNFSRLNNEAVPKARGEILGFLNNDLEVLEDGWLTDMVSYAVRPECGAVGARLLFPNGALQHGGVVLGIGGVAGHSHKGRLREDPGYFNRSILAHNCSAVTAACLLVRREVFSELGGFDEGDLAVAFNDVDLCLKIREAGYLNVYVPEAEFYHFESASRGYENTPEKFSRFEKEIGAMKDRWGKALENDPFYNPNLTLLDENFSFAFPPRAAQPWREEKPSSD